MDLGTILDTVVDITGRPDKESYVNATVNPVIRSIAAIKDMPADLVETTETVSNTLVVHNINVPLDMRKVAYLRPQPFTKLLTLITPQRAIYDEKEMVNCYYRSGNILVIRLQTGFETTSISFGYYSFPATVSARTDTNWVITDYGDIVIDMLASKVLRVTGDAKGAAVIESGVSLRLAELANSMDGVAVVGGLPSVR